MRASTRQTLKGSDLTVRLGVAVLKQLLRVSSPVALQLQ